MSAPAKMRRCLLGLTALAVALLPAGCDRDQAPLPPARAAAALDAKLNWNEARLIAVQDGGRYKTLDSFSREWLRMMYGAEHFPSMTPSGSLLEWLFNRDAYNDVPVIRIKDAGVRVLFEPGLSTERQKAVAESKRLTPRELADPARQQMLRQLASNVQMQRAINRVLDAQAVAERMDEFLAIVPQPGGDLVAPWYAPRVLLGSLSDDQLVGLGMTRAALPPESRQPIPGLTPDAALTLISTWSSLRAAWLEGNADRVQGYLDRLVELLPKFAGPGVYPTHGQRAAEARYYATGKFTGGWMFYFIALLVSIFALVTGWRIPWIATIVLLLAALGFHAYGLGLRWYILGRVPVANDFESIVAAAWIGIVVALLIELSVRTRVLLVGAAATGFVGLVVATFVPSGGQLAVVPGILDDVQLRIHTVMVIWAYALIFLAAVVAAIYLLGYYGVALRRMGAGPRPIAAGANGSPDVAMDRPLLAGAAPGDEAHRGELPAWLNNTDWAHLILLNMIFVLLFLGGLIFGAWWADYSWGRPWGWDPKEVFALNTWIIYAILLHTRFVVRNRGLWTAWLSIAGCIMMAFNWFFVNYFIASVHSYV